MATCLVRPALSMARCINRRFSVVRGHTSWHSDNIGASTIVFPRNAANVVGVPFWSTSGIAGTARFWMMPCDAEGGPGSELDEHAASVTAARTLIANARHMFHTDGRERRGNTDSEARQTQIDCQITSAFGSKEHWSIEQVGLLPHDAVEEGPEAEPTSHVRTNLALSQ